MKFIGALAFVAAVFLGSNVNAFELGEDGLHKTKWQQETFKDMR